MIKGGGKGTNSQTFGTTALTTLHGFDDHHERQRRHGLEPGLRRHHPRLAEHDRHHLQHRHGHRNDHGDWLARAGCWAMLATSPSRRPTAAPLGSPRRGVTPFTLAPLADGSYSTTYATGNNVEVTSGDSQSGVTVNTLRFKTGSDALTLAGMNIINTGGILVTQRGHRFQHHWRHHHLQHRGGGSGHP